MTDRSLLPFFQPQGVVVIGASSTPEKLGYGVARNLFQSGYAGGIHFVAQKSGEIFGRKIHTSLTEVPDPVDLAVLIVPTQSTPQTIEECAKRGIKAAVIVSAGFREVGAQGAALEERCVDIARSYGMRLLGPNCIGTIDTHLPLDTTFLQPPLPARGGIGFISHSGAFCAGIVDWAREEGFGFSRIVSLGNQADVDETDMLSIFADDHHTKVIVLYMESVSDGRRFVEIARDVSRRKPIIALKAGRFESGQRAAASHTGAMAASDYAFDAAFSKAGILRAETTEQMFDWARALEVSSARIEVFGSNGQKSTHGESGIAILTNAGGPGVIAADSLEGHDLPLAKFTDASLAALSAELPPSASVRNPVDMLASASPDTYASCLEILLSAQNVGGAIVILPPPPMFNAEVVAEKLIRVTKLFHKPVVVALLGSTLVANASILFREASIPSYPFVERAVSALSAIFRRAERLKQKLPDVSENLRLQTRTTTPSLDVLLAEYAIPVAPIKLAKDLTEAKAIAEELGYPVVLKIASPDILHKSDAGGVILNVLDSKMLGSAFEQLMDLIKTTQPDARLDGVHVQTQISEGQEVIVGMVRDPSFGPLIMFGSGGVEAEGLRDVAFALAPLNQAEMEEMILKTWAGRRLAGFRNIPPADTSAVLDVLRKLSRLALENPELAEFEINPLRVMKAGALAVDCRMKTVAPR